MLKIAHRGASAYVAENTMAAFSKGLAMGADGVELDVHRCASGEVVVMHDETVDRTTTGKGRVADFTLNELQKLTTKDGAPVPTLESVFELLGKQAYCFIEIKNADAALPAAILISQFVSKGFRADRLIMISFNHEALQKAQQAFPALVIGASFEKLTEHSIADAVAMKARFILPHHKTLTPARLAQAHAAHLQVIPWTINDERDILRLREMGVDGIISDYPDRLNV